jgi:plastocyanin
MVSLTAPRRLLAVALALLAAPAGALLLLSPGQPAGAAVGHTLKLRADAHGMLKFDKSKLTTTHGKVTLVMTNPKTSGLSHAVAVEGKGIDKDGKTASPGKTSRVTVTLKKGTYAFYCPVDGHRASGMKGKLVVK